ncbi:MAG: response regulator, partial [Lachnospiraceae bacterium]|nr:response regulator [Lachnospiraceae bacterium]
MTEIVIVDDEMLSRIGIQTLLDGAKDIHVRETFDDAQDALDYLKENPVDILLTDLEMTGMQGMDLIREVKSRYKNMGILILSCHNDFHYAREALEIGADGYLLKHELNTERLCCEIRKIYEKKSKSRFLNGSV